MSETSQARIGADIGGTFTDVVLEHGAARHRVKLLTTHDAPERALLDAIGQLLAEAGLQWREIDVIVHGTTLATNALIERRGARTALLTTEGFRDVLEMGDESRFDQYDLTIEKPAPLIARPWRIGIAERMAADGSILLELERASVQRAAQILIDENIESVAIAFLHSYANPRHERLAADMLREAIPGLYVSLSCEVSPEMREYQRFSTTAANAYVQPIVAGYLARLETQLARRGFAGALCLMLSSGGITTVETARRFPVRLVESGPAGGAAFAADIARRGALPRALAFDMGGTTAKLCLIDDAEPHGSQSFEAGRVHRFRRGSGLPLRIPVVEMVEIGAGGGSIARRDAARGIAVGPHSAGSSPGPACYGLGGAAPTVTDADLLLGKLDAESFAGGRLRLSRDAATDAMAALGAPHDAASDMALAISEIVDEAMASAARVHAVEQGVAIAGRTMIAFGGAAPLHAARVAEKLDIDTVMIPRDAAVGSAVGFLRAPTAYEAARSCRQALAAIDLDEVNAVLSELAESVDAVVANAAGAMPRQQSRTAFARYAGQGSEIPVPLPTRPLTAADAPLIRQGFERAYGNLYGPIVPNLPVEILSWRVRVVAETAQTQAPLAEAPEASRVQRANGESRVARANRQQPLRDSLASAARSTPVYDRDTLCPGDLIEGPAIIAERDTTTIVTGSFDVQVDRYLALILRRRGRAQPAGMPS